MLMGTVKISVRESRPSSALSATAWSTSRDGRVQYRTEYAGFGTLRYKQKQRQQPKMGVTWRHQTRRVCLSLPQQLTRLANGKSSGAKRGPIGYIQGTARNTLYSGRENTGC